MAVVKLRRGSSMHPGQSFPSEIVFMTGVELSRAIKSRRVSCVEVMSAYLDQIDRFNPRVNAIVSLQGRENLLAQAMMRDEQLSRGEYLGWMHGFPQAVKDLAPVKGIPMTMGSPILKNFVPTTDAIFVERIKRAGGIIVGKTNTPEFGLGSQTYNSVFGATPNAYDRSRTAGGSSGGAAVALAMRMLPVADGSDHAGSLRNPAAYNNVLGFRTSYGRVPSEAKDIFGAALGVIGPMARTVMDLAMFLAVQAGYDPRSPLSIRQDPGQFTEPLKRDMAGSRIAWLGDWGGYLAYEPGVLDLCKKALRTFESLGCIVEEARPEFPPELVWESWVKLRAWQAGNALREFYDDSGKRELMKPEARFEVESGLKLSAFEIADAATVRSTWYHVVRQFFDRYDYLVLPSAQLFPFDVSTHWPSEINGRSMDTYHRWMEGMVLVTMTGCPALNVPAGFNDQGLPMGFQIVGPNHAEMDCLRLAAAYEEATGWVERRRPALLTGG